MTGPSPKTREIVYRRALFACERCGGNPYGGAVHHRRPRGLGGSKRGDTNSPANLACLCNDCHLVIESHRTMAHASGWLVRQGKHPSSVPVLTVRGWVLLTDEGAYLPVGEGEGEASDPAGGYGGAA